ncbi:MAG: tetraacyldisaccharide 4'-kinase [Rhodospirillales bacterium]|nr:tetraacyldisaccharide 4'-kinase [Rhodospirillales bacterium]
MALRTPEFWYQGRGVLPILLGPLGSAYGIAGRLRRKMTTPAACGVPVICVGNVVAGGAGKTPTALHVAERCQRAGIDVHFLSRGYGGREKGPLRVDPETHTAADVGDEPLLLAGAAPAWISADRLAGARAAAEAGARLIVMDDGFQNPALAKDLSIIAIDGDAGFGNGRMIPAGPLREPPAAALARAQAVVIIGRDSFGISGRLRESTGGRVEVMLGRLQPGPEIERLKARPLLAFAGIARPEKFFNTLRDSGCELTAARPFADHHPFSRGEIADLRGQAGDLDAALVTTAKDFVRLHREDRNDVQVLTVRLALEDQAALDRLLEPVLAQAGAG